MTSLRQTVIDFLPQAVQPGFPVSIVQGFIMLHFGNVFGRVKIIPLDEAPSQMTGQCFPDCGFTGAGYTSENNNPAVSGGTEGRKFFCRHLYHLIRWTRPVFPEYGTPRQVIEAKTG